MGTNYYTCIQLQGLIVLNPPIVVLCHGQDNRNVFKG